MTISQTIEYAESVVGPELEKELSDHLQLARDATDLAGELIERVGNAPGDPRAVHASTVLIARIVTDLQAVCHLIRLGYAEQAISLTATMLELAHLNMYIGTNEKRAEKWLSHSNPKQASPWDLKTMIRGTAKTFGEPEHEMMREYDKVYQDINLTKHGNPMSLANTTLEHRGGVTYILAGPHLSDAGRRLAREAIIYGVRYTYLASMKYIMDHVPASERQPMFAVWKGISSRWLELIAAAAKEFGEGDGAEEDPSH